MTQPHLLEQAKQGDPQAIAALMNKSLQPKGMTAYVERQGDHLDVVLKSDRIPNRQALTAFVEQGIQNLGVETIRSVTVSGQQLGASSSAWTEQLDLNPLIPEFEPEFADPVAANVTFNNVTLDSDTEQDAIASFNTSEPSDLAQLQDLLSDQSDQSSADPQRQELESRLESLWLEQSQDQHQDFLAELMADEPQDATRQFEEFLADQPDDRYQSQEQEGLWNAPESDNLLADLELEDSKQALTQELETSSYGWQDSDAELEDEPDEVLFSFMEDQPQPPADLSLDDDGDLLDEPDEILPGFLEPNAGGSPAASNNYDTSFQTPSSDYSGLNEPPIDLLGEMSLSDSTENNVQDLDFSSATGESSDEEFLDLLGDSSEEQDQGLLSELTDHQPGAMNWNNNSSEPSGEFSFNSSPDSRDELSLGVEEEPASSEIDFAGEYSEASADATSQDWEHPPIEFLQSEPEPPSLELPTEQFDAPADFRTEPSMEDGDDRLADFPPDFLQEAPADQSHDLFVEPQTNPFIEQMEEQDRERSQKPEDRPGEESNQFNQSEWLLEDDPNLQSPGTENSQYAEDSDPLSDEALINFFEEDTEESGTGAQFSSGTNQFDTDQFSEYRVRPDNPDGSFDSPEDSPADRGEFVLDESMSLSDLDRSDQSDQEEYLDLSLEPDEPEYSDYYGSAGIADTQIPSNDIPDSDYSSDPAYTDSNIADTQIPAHQEPSEEELEQQVAAIYPDDRPVVVNSGAELEPVSESRGSPWLFPLILLGISGWIVGLISFAFLWSRLSSPPPETAETAPADVVASPNAAPTACPPTTQATGNVPIALSELQFQQNESNPQQINLTGCVTNRTQQAIDIVSIGYRSGTGSASTVGGLNFSTGIIQPGQTVPFTSKFTLPSDTTDLSIGTVYWQPAGQTTSREANTSVKLSR